MHTLMQTIWRLFKVYKLLPFMLIISSWKIIPTPPRCGVQIETICFVCFDRQTVNVVFFN